MSVQSNLASGVWWKAALMRALRTALVIAIPYAPVILDQNLALLAVSAAGFGFLTSILTSLFGIPEAVGKIVPWYWALLERVVKTAAQALLTAFGTATMFSEVSWDLVLPVVLTSVLGSLLLGVLNSLPEAEDPTSNSDVTLNTVNVNNIESVDMGAVTRASDASKINLSGKS